jgi:hypothetical protein
MGAGALFLIVDRHTHRNFSMLATLSAQTAAVQWRLPPLSEPSRLQLTLLNRVRPVVLGGYVVLADRSGAGTNRAAGDVS